MERKDLLDALSVILGRLADGTGDRALLSYVRLAYLDNRMDEEEVFRHLEQLVAWMGEEATRFGITELVGKLDIPVTLPEGSGEE